MKGSDFMTMAELLEIAKNNPRVKSLLYKYRLLTNMRNEILTSDNANLSEEEKELTVKLSKEITDVWEVFYETLIKEASKDDSKH